MLVGLVGLVRLAWVGSINSRQFLSLYLIAIFAVTSLFFTCIYSCFFQHSSCTPFGLICFNHRTSRQGPHCQHFRLQVFGFFWNPNGWSLEKVATWRAPECHEGRVWEAVKWCHLGESFESIHARRHWKSLTVYGFVQKNGSQLCRNPRWKDIGDGGGWFGCI